MATPVSLALGTHLLLEPVLDWETQFSGTNPPRVVLTASVQSDPNPPSVPILGNMATTVALQMDARVAIALYEKLGALGRSMGWLPQKEAGNRA